MLMIPIAYSHGRESTFTVELADEAPNVSAELHLGEANLTGTGWKTPPEPVRAILDALEAGGGPYDKSADLPDLKYLAAEVKRLRQALESIGDGVRFELDPDEARAIGSALWHYAGEADVVFGLARR